jgi:hypothetical protein
VLDWRFEYADVSADPLASTWSRMPLEVSAALDELGFERLGFSLALLPRRRLHLVHEVRVSSDGTTQAVGSSGSPAVELVSLLEDGTVLKTVPRPPPAIWRKLGPGMKARPADRHDYEAIDADLAGVLARHRERVAELALARGSAAVPLTSMIAHFAIRLRSAELLRARIPWQIGISFALTAIPASAASIGITLHFYQLERSLEPGVMLLCILASMIVFIPMLPLCLWYVAPHLARWVRAPEPAYAFELMQRAKGVPSGRLPRALD